MPCFKCIEHEWPDPQPERTGQKYCLFHAPAGVKGVSAEEFNAQVFARIDMFKAKAAGKDKRCNLSGTIFPGDISFKAYGKDNPLPGISFSKATFSGKTDFEGVTFNGMANFMQATFSGQANFMAATFGDTTTFAVATFDAKANFMAATFATFASFREAEFRDQTDFEVATFNIVAIFEKMKAKKNALLMHSLNNATLSSLYFTSMETECFSFKGCDWPDKLNIETQNDHKACEELYRSLKQKAASEHDQPLVSKWHYREKLMGMRQKWYRRFVPITPTWLYWASNGFGERSVRAWWLLVGLCLVPFVLFGFERILETARSGSPDWKIISTVFDEWSLCVPFVQTGFKGTAKAAELEPWKLRVAWIFQILIALQASLFAFALRNRFRR